jgi:hypothetical protein
VLTGIYTHLPVHDHTTGDYLYILTFIHSDYHWEKGTGNFCKKLLNKLPASNCCEKYTLSDFMISGPNGFELSRSGESQTQGVRPPFHSPSDEQMNVVAVNRVTASGKGQSAYYLIILKTGVTAVF